MTTLRMTALVGVSLLSIGSGVAFGSDLENADAKSRNNTNLERAEAGDKALAEAIAKEKADPNTRHARCERAGGISIGVPASRLLICYDKPAHINRTVTSYGIDEQWVYYRLYFYVKDGIVTSWQETQ